MEVYKGKSVDEAIENGLLDLNLKKEDVHIHVLEKGQAGIFGFFEKEAEVEITPLTEKELKLKKLAPYLSAGGFVILILFFILIGVSQNNKSNSSTSLSSSTNPSSVTEKSTEKTTKPSSTSKESSTSSSSQSSSTSSSSNSVETSSTSPSQSSTITIENNSEFQALLQTEDQSTITDFVQKYKGKTIEFDGNFADLAKVKSKYDILIHSGDYHPDEATGPNFKFIEINLISNPVFKPFNGENIRKGQNVHIKAKVGGYNATQDLIYLSPIEVSPR